MAPRKKKPSPRKGGPVFAMSYVRNGKRIVSKTGKPFVFYPKDKAA